MAPPQQTKDASFSWLWDEQSRAVHYYALKCAEMSKFKPNLVAKVNVPSEYVDPLVARAFALHPAMYEVVAGDSNATPDLIVSHSSHVMILLVSFMKKLT